MALQASYGDYPEAYIRIERFSGNKNEVSAMARIYADADAVNESATEDFGFSFAYDINASENVLTQGYTYLKALPNFEGAIDV